MWLRGRASSNPGSGCGSPPGATPGLLGGEGRAGGSLPAWGGCGTPGLSPWGCWCWGRTGSTSWCSMHDAWGTAVVRDAARSRGQVQSWDRDSRAGSAEVPVVHGQSGGAHAAASPELGRMWLGPRESSTWGDSSLVSPRVGGARPGQGKGLEGMTLCPSCLVAPELSQVGKLRQGKGCMPSRAARQQQQKCPPTACWSKADRQARG